MNAPPVCRDMDELDKSFRAVVDLVIADMHAEGFDAVVFETLRTPERGAWLQATGKSKNGAASMHCYRIAADVISKSKMWNAGKAFWQALGRIAKKHGLTWGGDWKTFVDSPHIQACAVSEQNELRAMTADERAAWCAQRFA